MTTSTTAPEIEIIPLDGDYMVVAERDHGGWLITWPKGGLVLATDGKWIDLTLERLDAEGEADEITWHDREAGIRAAKATEGA